MVHFTSLIKSGPDWDSPADSTRAEKRNKKPTQSNSTMLIAAAVVCGLMAVPRRQAATDSELLVYLEGV